MDLPAGDPSHLYDGPADVAVEDPIFEVVDGDLVDGIVTEQGILDESDVVAMAEAFEEFATWAEEDG